MALALVFILPLALAACSPGQFLPRGWAGLTLEGDTLFVATGEGRLLAVGLQDFSLRWQFPPQGQKPLGPVYSAPQIASDRLYVASSTAQRGRGLFGGQTLTGTVYALTLKRDRVENAAPEQAWAFPSPGLGRKLGILVANPAVTDALLLVGSSDGHLYGVNKKGELEWTFPPAGKVGKVWTRPVVADGVVYFGSLEHRLYAVRLADGSQIWPFEAEGAIVGAPLILGGRLYFGTTGRTMYALDAATGKEVWRQPLDGWAWGSPVSDGQTLYVATLGGTLYALDPARKGAQKWAAPLSGPAMLPPTLLPDGLAVATEDRVVQILNPANGQERRRCFLNQRVRTPMVAQGELLYLVDVTQDVHELNTRSCTVRTLPPLQRK